jgi:xanthosine utilization system XapX-like protein
MRANRRNHLRLFAGWSAYASGVVAIFGLLPSATFPFGVNLPRLNDSAVIVQYLLALPITFALYPLVRARAPIAGPVATLVGIVGILGTAVIQVAWIFGPFGTMEWAVYIILVATSMLMIGAWVVITGFYLRRSTGPLRHRLLMSILAATYVAYPIWAIWLGGLLLADKLTTVADPVARRETELTA